MQFNEKSGKKLFKLRHSHEGKQQWENSVNKIIDMVLKESLIKAMRPVNMGQIQVLSILLIKAPILIDFPQWQLTLDTIVIINKDLNQTTFLLATWLRKCLQTVLTPCLRNRDEYHPLEANMTGQGETFAFITIKWFSPQLLFLA